METCFVYLKHPGYPLYTHPIQTWYLNAHISDDGSARTEKDTEFRHKSRE